MTWEVYHALTGKVAKSGFATEHDAGMYVWSLSDPHMLRRKTVAKTVTSAPTISVTPEELALLATYASNGAEDRREYTATYPGDYTADEQVQIKAECERVEALCARILHQRDESESKDDCAGLREDKAAEFCNANGWDYREDSDKIEEWCGKGVRDGIVHVDSHDNCAHENDTVFTSYLDCYREVFGA